MIGVYLTGDIGELVRMPVIPQIGTSILWRGEKFQVVGVTLCLHYHAQECEKVVVRVSRITRENPL